MSQTMEAQKFPASILYEKGSPALLHILNNPDTFRYQLIYTKIDRDKSNKPSFTHYRIRTDRTEYFNPASTVKMPLAFLALEKLHHLKGVKRETPMLTDSAFSNQTIVTEDKTAENGLPSIAHYIKKIFLVSDNDAYNRLYEFLGQQYINESLWRKGYRDMRVTRRFTPMTEEENRHTNPVRFVENGKTVYSQPAACSKVDFDFSKKVFLGKAHYNRDEQLVPSPMDFTKHNNAPLEDLQQMLQSVLFPESVNSHQRFDLDADDYSMLYRVMSQMPSESRYPAYDTTEFFDSYTKFMYKTDGVIPDGIRVFNKTGWSYGFLTDVAYIVDFNRNIEFMLSGVIYVNSDGVLNDDKYEYRETGYPFFKEVGNIFYQYELQRKRKYPPDLSKFRISYAE
ncbi:MAG: serine hydrolase [Chitinophagaceae bacterium]|nr:serine hydrolase [Chitinophagaceae bacterium]